jgi:hypothetical protein
MTFAALVLAAAVAAAGNPGTAAPFRLPIGARVTSASPDGRGWCVSGEIGFPFVQAKARLLSAATAAGWRHLHTIPLGRKGDRVLMAFSRGDTELTVMVTRRGVAKSAFSCGVSAKEKGRK